jgi:DNA-binding CsgD family transcriptional regulator
MRNYNIAFFIYILIGFADFYRTFFFLKWEMNVLLMILYNVGLLVFAYHWLRFSQEFLGNSPKGRIKIIIIEGSISLAAWAVVYLFFMDKEYNLSSILGKVLGFLPDSFFYLTLAAYGLIDILFARKNRNLNQQGNTYFIIANFMILFQFCWGYLADTMLVFYPFGAQINELYPFNPMILVYLAFNIMTIVYLCRNNFFLVSSDRKSEKEISNQEAELYTIEELAGKYHLTKREKELTQLVFRGLSNPEISVSLNISTGTVKRHIQNIYKKMDIKSRYELIYLIKSE